LGTFHGHQIFFITATFTAIFGFISCHFYCFSLQILLLLAFLLLSLWVLVLCPLFKLLGSLLMPTSLLLLAFLLLLGRHKLVSDCMAHGHQFSTDIQVLKLPHFWKVAVMAQLVCFCERRVGSSI
jgi:hypothetical protein